MTLRFTVLGYELARITLDIEHRDLPPVTTAVEHAVERGVKAISKSWVKRMVR